MDQRTFQVHLRSLGELIRRTEPSLSFTILEIGGLPLQEEKEVFHDLLDYFPESRIVSFEVDEKLCEELNKRAKPGLRYYPTALAQREETRPFYVTNHPTCCSLYKPDDELLDMYNNMEVSMLKSVESIRTSSLDDFVRENDIGPVDFIKIDIQGAELDVFRGGVEALRRVLFIVSEVEFIRQYIDQPLFGDISVFLSGQGLMFHKFLGLNGRSLKPLIIANDPYYPSQHIWSDAVFIKDLFKLPEISPGELLKLGMLSFMYGSPDLTFHCMKIYDEKKGTDIRSEFLRSNAEINEKARMESKKASKRKRPKKKPKILK